MPNVLEMEIIKNCSNFTRIPKIENTLGIKFCMMSFKKTLQKTKIPRLGNTLKIKLTFQPWKRSIRLNPPKV
jgi:hypothetical protein